MRIGDWSSDVCSSDLAARSVASASASYLLFRNQTEARSIIAEIAAPMIERFGAFLVFEIAELEADSLAEDAAYLPPFEIQIAASEAQSAQAALAAVASSIQAEIGRAHV